MSMPCPNCSEPEPSYESSQCPRCGYFLGWPNYRKALTERSDLLSRSNAARADLAARGLGRLAILLEQIARDSTLVITMWCEACYALIKSGKYRNYYSRVEISDRLIASEHDHGVRSMINDRIYPGYGKYLHYGNLSPDGAGLPNYGEVAVQWHVDLNYLSTRATLLEENEFNFFDRHHLGNRLSMVPAGFRSAWDDRAELALAKVHSEITAATAESELPKLIMLPGADRSSDRFIEAVVFAQDGLDRRDVEKVTLLTPLADPALRDQWQVIKEVCAARGVALAP